MYCTRTAHQLAGALGADVPPATLGRVLAHSLVARDQHLPPRHSEPVYDSQFQEPPVQVLHLLVALFAEVLGGHGVGRQGVLASDAQAREDFGRVGGEGSGCFLQGRGEDAFDSDDVRGGRFD